MAKPTVIFIREDKGEVTLSTKEIQELVEEAYNNGYEDGRKCTPIISPYTYTYSTTGQKDPCINQTKITC